MRVLIYLCLVTGLLAGESPKPGHDPVFQARILADSDGGRRPWKTYRMPEDTPSAVVEVIGKYSREELRQIAFEEFLVWFREDLRRFWVRYGSSGPALDGSSATQALHRFGGNPTPENVPLARVGF
jgi:hypothetical protein